MKWCWSRLPGGVVTWEAYELFKIGEKGTVESPCGSHPTRLTMLRFAACKKCICNIHTYERRFGRPQTDRIRFL